MRHAHELHFEDRDFRHHMKQSAQLLNRWLELCHHIGAQRGHLYYVALYRHIAHYYNSPGRHYHNLDHIKSCLVKFDEIKHLLDEPDVVELAFWFHDAINEVWANDNEIRSAELAMFFIVHLMGLPRELARRVAYLIERTNYFAKDKEMHEPRTNDAKYLVDIDLFCGLGGSPQTFEKNKKLNIKEYDWRDKSELNKKLLNMFTMFHRRSPFYLTDYFRDRYEIQTKTNLEGAIKELERQILPSKALLNQELPKGVNPDYVVLVDGVYYDLCVFCKVNTGIRTDCPVNSRNYYEVQGQLCGDCWFKTYPSA